MDKLSISRGILFAVAAVFWFAQYAYTPYVNPQLMAMGASASIMGFVGGAYGLLQFVLRVPIGVGADRWQRKFFICAGSLFAGLSALCMLVFYSPAGFIAGRALAGVASSAWVPYTVLYASYYKPEHATRAITMLNLANRFGRLAAFVMAGAAAASFGPRSAFVLSAAGGFLAFGISLFVREDKAGDRRPLRLGAFIEVAKERNLLVTTILAVLTQLVAFATYATFAANHAVYIGAAPAQLGYMHVALLAPGILLNFCLSKYILSRVGAKWLVVSGFFVTAIYCAAMPFVATIPQLYLMQAVAGMGNTLTLSLLMGMCVQNIAPERRGAAMGFFQSVFAVGMMAGPLIMGVITDYFSLRTGFFLMAGVSAATIFLAAALLGDSGKAAQV
ncbi:MAG: MFS transporter [Oscillospiraceae bacterium]|nr:MFS transporter [Oscillospiraceae bacterium]